MRKRAPAAPRIPSFGSTRRSNIYHFAGRRDYGNRKQGAYMCEADAKAAGDRAAKNEKHP